MLQPENTHQPSVIANSQVAGAWCLCLADRKLADNAHCLLGIGSWAQHGAIQRKLYMF